MQWAGNTNTVEGVEAGGDEGRNSDSYSLRVFMAQEWGLARGSIAALAPSGTYRRDCIAVGVNSVDIIFPPRPLSEAAAYYFGSLIGAKKTAVPMLGNNDLTKVLSIAWEGVCIAGESGLEQ